MSKLRPPQLRKPTFLWQGLLILLPVLVLSAIGLLSLRQDKLLVEQEARENARTIAHELALRLDAAMISARGPGPLAAGDENKDGQSAFEVDSAGRLVFPAPFFSTAVPRPFNRDHLNPEQELLWRAVETADAATQNGAAAMDVLRDFLAKEPPDDFAAAAHYAMAVLTSRDGEPEKAAETLEIVLARYPEAVLESGLPLQPLVELKLLELSLLSSNRVALHRALSPETFCSNVVYRPTPLTPYFLRTVASFEAVPGRAARVAEHWQAVWEKHEQARRLYHALWRTWLSGPEEVSDQGQNSDGLDHRNVTPQRSLSSVERSVWVDIGEKWLAIDISSGQTNWMIFCQAEETVARQVRNTVTATKDVPRYFQVGVEIADRPIAVITNLSPALATSDSVQSSATRKPAPAASQPPESEVSGARFSSDPPRLAKVTVHLTGSALLFARQRQRSRWFGSLLTLSSLTALIGFVAARRAFHHQLRLNELKSNFVSSVSHELRAPIASVRLMAEGLASGRVKEDHKKREYFKFIVQECRRLTSLVENVLDFARIEQGRKEYEFEPTDVAALVQQTVKTMELSAAERGVTLELRWPACPSLGSKSQPLLDGRAIQQALVNLIDNALKHSPKGSTVVVGLEVDLGSPAISPPITNHESPTAHLALWVEDAGPGIPVQEHERIFERFYRIGSELRRETSGVGIGLSIVKHIVEAHGGVVTVRSNVGQGSRFTIKLPLVGEKQLIRT